MNSIILEAKNVTKQYKQTLALDHINLQLKKGTIYGFIGQNGAGKTTFLRIITGLAYATEGSLSLWGKSSPKALQEQRKRIGCMIEAPALYPNLTAKQNLEVQRIQRGIPNKDIVTECLKMVKLSDTGNKKTKHFSMGMKQRLGIAMALLNNPEFLILDEPINGLDPAGIVEIRNLLKQLNKDYETTILISSHILEELYQTANEFILIHKGTLIEMLSQNELKERCRQHIAVKTNNPEQALLILEEQLKTEQIHLMPDGTLQIYDCLDKMEWVAQILYDAQILVTSLQLSGDTLEDYFLKKVGEYSYV